MNRFYSDEEKSARMLGVVGSLRENSFNGALMKAVGSILPDWVSIETFDISGIPHYNQDVEDSAIPGIVSEFKQKVRDADVILIAAPEYNGSVSGALKDALDWASRPYGNSSFAGKPVAILTAVSGRNGGRSVVNHMASIIDYLDARLIAEPVLVQAAAQKFDEQFNLTDEETLGKLGRLVTRIVEELPTKIREVCEVPA